VCDWLGLDDDYCYQSRDSHIRFTLDSLANKLGVKSTKEELWPKLSTLEEFSLPECTEIYDLSSRKFIQSQASGPPSGSSSKVFGPTLSQLGSDSPEGFATESIGRSNCFLLTVTTITTYFTAPSSAQEIDTASSNTKGTRPTLARRVANSALHRGRSPHETLRASRQPKVTKTTPKTPQTLP
jgi:hypothetical protein